VIGLTPAEAQAVRAAALTWRGTPFHPKAAKKGVGVGCIELIVASYLEAGFLQDLAFEYPWGYWQHKNDEEFMAELMRRFLVVEPPWEIGDGLTFARKPWPGTGHTALYIGGGEILHAIEDRVVDVWPLDIPVLTHTLHQGWRLQRG
jgi:cell wall-associated NlpC family hydrolase